MAVLILVVGSSATHAGAPSVLAASVPTAPRNVSVIAGNGSASIRWWEPAIDGGSLVLEYEVVVRQGDRVVQTTLAPAWNVEMTVADLVNELPHSVTVRARNTNGWGPYTSAKSFTPGDVWIVSLGDSFISGEAGRWAGNTNGLVASHDALGPKAYWDTADGEAIEDCHRSKAAEVNVGGVKSFNLACSGATTASQWECPGDVCAPEDLRIAKPGIDFDTDGWGRKGQALMLKEFASEHAVKAVVLSIGGNDLGFSDIMKICIGHFDAALIAATLNPALPSFPCLLDPGVIAMTTDDDYDDLRKDLVAAYQNVALAMTRAGYTADDWTLLIQDYPSILPPSLLNRVPDVPSPFRQTLYGCPILNADLDFFNFVLGPDLNDTVRQAVAAAALPNTKFLEMDHALDGRRLCEFGVARVGDLTELGVPSWESPLAADFSEWVNEVRLVADPVPADNPYSMYESMHPNYWAQRAFARCLRAAYNNGRPRGGECTIAGPGLFGSAERLEPNEVLRGSIENDSITTTGDHPPNHGEVGEVGKTQEIGISRDGRYVAFCSGAKLAAADENTWWDVYLRDRLLQTTTLVSVADDGAIGDAASCGYHGPSISGDGRFVAFESVASNLVASDKNGGSDIFVRDLRRGTTERISTPIDADGGWSYEPSISADGRYVAFKSDAKIDPNRTNQGLFVRDRLTGEGKLVSVGASGQQDRTANDPAISGDGRYVAFTSGDKTLVPGDTNNATDVFIRDRVAGTTERVAVMRDGLDVNTWAMAPAISGGGRFVTFSALVPRSPEGEFDWRIILHDRTTGQTKAISGGVSDIQPAIARDGRFVTWSAQMYNGRGIVLYNVGDGSTQNLAPKDASPGSFQPAVADDGGAVAFFDGSNTITPGDDHSWDVFTWSLECAGTCGQEDAALAATLAAPDSPTNASTLSYSVEFDRPVSGLSADDFVRVGTAAGCIVGTPSGSGASYAIAVTGCSDGTVALALKANTVVDQAAKPGPASDVAAASVIVDRTAPSTPSLSVAPHTGSALSGTAVPLSIAWTAASDAGSGVACYELQRSVNGGTWTPISTTPTARSTSATAASSGSVRYRVRPVDNAGNPGNWSYTAVLSPRLIQQSSTAVKYRGTWTTAKSSSYSGGSARYAKVAGRSASYTFTGRSIALVSTKASSRGRARIYVNGTLAATVDLHRSGAQYRVVVWQQTWSRTVTRTVKVVVAGTSGRPRVDLDAFAVVR